MCHRRSRLIDSMERFLEWHLIVEGFTCIGNEDGWNQQRIANDKDWRCRIPCRVATRLKSGADATRRERAGIRLLLHKGFAFKLFHHTAFAVVLHKAVVLLSRTFRQGLEPVGIVRDTILNRPFLDAQCHSVSNRTVERRAIVNHVTHLLIHV